MAVYVLIVDGGVAQHGNSAAGNVLAGHPGENPVAGRSADHAVLPGQQRQEIKVEVVPQEPELPSGRPDVLLSSRP